MNTAIFRSFSGGMEISQEDAEALFDEYLSSPQLKALGRNDQGEAGARPEAL
ncbi:MAG: hypothetical protein MZV63_00500 [Marinilabiliales bacterium]|nr:hypothetical protein [Marinilabiliales bacterium]